MGRSLSVVLLFSKRASTYLLLYDAEAPMTLLLRGYEVESRLEIGKDGKAMAPLGKQLLAKCWAQFSASARWRPQPLS